nr:dystrophin-like isoform X4 [Penaeus vannamei]
MPKKKAFDELRKQHRCNTLTRRQLANEREDVQKKTFAKWINSQLAKGQHPPVTDLFYDLRDGTRLLALLEVLTNKTYKREKGRMRVHHLNNVSRALSILEEHNVKLINISNEHIVDGSAKLTLGLVWAIILHWQVQGVLKDVMSDLQQTNLEKTLLAWCRQTTKGYHGVDVRNFTTSWTDGLAFNALIHSHRPQLFDWTVMARKHPYARLENAFRLANEHFNIERLLDPEDVNSQVPDKKSIMMYVMCLFQALPHGSFTMESLDVSIQSDSSFSLDTSSENVAQASSKGRPLSNVSIGLGEYQRTLEEVLTWLLGAEDRLAVMPPIANTTEEVKDQFHDLEELMLELTSKQGGIGDVLGEGSRLLKEGVMEEEEEEEVRVQMKLLNTRWEELRVKAMDRQSRLHEKLMTLQQTQLESLKKWLTETEDRIANMSQVGPTTDLLREQIAAHQSLQEDLENEQANINSLSNMVVVVDESSSDSGEAYSSLEDELNALGERWAHICRWAESRWKTLQTLSVHWTHYEQEMNKMGEWMNEKESLLREVESNPSSDQEHILRQASMLQIVQAEMEVQHRRFEHLQEESAKVLSHLPQDSPGQEKIPSELEMVQDRLDCLVSIIEAQTQRMAANGIDIKKIVIPADNTSDIVSSSTTTISHEDATVVTKIITTKIVTTETVEGSVIKRQKLEGGSQEDFSVALHQLGGWMDSLEAEVRPKVAGELTIEQLMQLAQQLENEIEGQKEEYYKVVSLGQSAISETSTIGESAKESEQQVAGITSRWEALNAMLIEIRTRITFLTEKKKVTTQLSDLEVQYEGFLRWCEDVRTVSENEPNAVSLQIEQCQSKIAAMESHEAEIGALKVACEGLDGKFAQETQPVMEQVQIFITKWEALKTRLIEWNVTLKERLGQVSPSPMVVETVQTAPPESLVKAMEASRKWLESLETALAAEHVVSSLPQMQDMLLKFQDLSQKVEMEQGNMKHINDACTALIKEGQLGISDDFTKLNKQWETTTEALQSRIKAIEKVIEKEKQYNDEVSGLCSWMSEVDVFLQAEEPALGDIETLEAQLEQSNALQDDIVTLENNVANITTSGKQLMEEAEPELKGAITVQLDELTKRWALVTELAKAQNKSLKDALAKSQKVHEDIQALNTWLDEMDQKVPAFAPIETSSELSAAIDMFNKLREEISEHSEEFRGVNNTGNEMLQHDAAATHEELARQFTQLNGRWTDVVTQVDSRHRVLSTASEQYDDFKKLCGEETEWLNQLQEKLEKSSKSAADAEEISEALDDLEIFLHSHNESRLEQIRNLAEALVQENCMSVAVQNATHTLTSRFDTLNAQASEHQSGLEGRVQEAQAWEREYVSVLDYLVQSDMVLTQAITDSQLRIDPVQVQTELVKQQEVLKKMQAQVDVYRTQGKTEAALRLEDQVTHLLKKYEEVEMKLRLCQKPSDFDDRLQQMNQELKDISQRVHLVTVTSGDPEGIQEQLNQCMALYQRLSEVKAEVESVIATGRKIVKEGQALDPETLTLQLDQLKGLYNQLGGTVTEHRGVLERALRHSRKIHKDSSHLEEWLSTTECELDQREATIPTRNVEGEVHFAQHAIDDLGRKRPLLTGLHESYAALASMCDDDALLQPIKEQVDDIALTWERVNTRLANRLKNMQSEQVNKEAEMEKFIVGLGEIKGWLQSTEYQLTNLSKVDADEQARIIKSISTEVQNYKGHIENIRDTAVDLINHGALFQARVQPELIEINQRWENIFKNVQQCSQDIQGTSLTSVTLTAETQGSRPSPSQTNTTTTTNLSTFSTSDVHETSVTTSLTSTTTQLIHTMGTTQVSDELMVHVHQQDDASTPVQSSWAGDNTSKNEEQEKGASLRSIGLVKSVMSTGTTLTSPVIDESETMEDVTESKLVHSVEGKPVSEISETHRETDENDVPIPGLKTVDVSDSMEMFSSADSARWGESSLVDSVIKVEPKENQTADEDHTLTLVTNTVTKKVDRSSSEMEGIDTETVKYVLDEQPSDDTEQKKMSLVEVEEVKMTISHLSFNIAGTSSEKKVDKVEAGILACGSSEESPIDSSLEVSPTAEYPPNSLLSSDLSSRDSPGKDRKRKITENDDDLDNFDELIAGLKEVAEKDITLSAVEKNRRRSAEKELDQDLSGDERFSLLKIRRRDDDDLESLASVDTDMAPASETSRDFEGTFSDLESVTESVSSKGDNLFAPMGAHGLTILDTSRNEEVSTVEFISQQTQLVTSEAVTHAYISSSQQLVSPESKESLSDIISAKISSISSGVTSDNKQSVTEKEVSEKDIDAEEESHAQKDYEQLPVEKLQAMIAELEEVMSDAELSDTEDEEDPQRRSELPAEKMDVSENIQRSKTEQLPIKDVVMKDDAATEVMEEILAPDIDKTNNELSSTEKDEPITDLSVIVKERSLAKDEVKCEADPIEFRVQSSFGDVEFAQAKGLFEKDPGSLETPASVVKITTPLHDDVSNETSSMTSTNKTTEMSDDKDKSVQKVSVQSSQVVHGITYVSSTENRLPEAEEAVLVTLISRPSSARGGL